VVVLAAWLLVAGCGQSPPTTELDGQTVLVVREPATCDDESACPERIRVGNRHYVPSHVLMSEEALGEVHGVSVDGPVGGIDRVRAIEGVPTDAALGARIEDGRWMVVTADRIVSEHRAAFCAAVDQPAAFRECPAGSSTEVGR
jgi:hypothetical protein